MEQNPNKANAAKPLQSMANAALRHRAMASSAPPHHSANQNIGWVMADNTFETKNISFFLRLAIPSK